MTRPTTRDLRARSVLAGEASAAAAELEAALRTPPVTHAAAFFDVDNTMLRGASVHHLAGGLYRRGALGTIAESRDGICTGRLAGDIVHDPAKAEAVRAPAAHERLHLADCAVNPDSRLRRQAEVAGRQVRDYRTGRKAARRALLTAGVSGVTLGAVSAAVAIRGSVGRRTYRTQTCQLNGERT
ncbi:hypothetical protein [Kribbella sp. CA-293567]|uniref:hypothetical protein n=1 Tax=Kribbella sp. CA-293567 TaxID=3002436 RepID=UPI0022DDE4FB|nr:hypothetical protein [Kribbella sp. CA-293567]WBQ06171.1 hypothetical protein OX958_05040 [Kribbella sp. CA-293567]